MMAVEANSFWGFCQNNGSANYKSVWAFPETFPFRTFSCHSTNLDVRVIPESFCFGIWYVIGIWTNCDDSFGQVQTAKCKMWEGSFEREGGRGFKTWLELVYLFNFLNCHVTGKIYQACAWDPDSWRDDLGYQKFIQSYSARKSFTTKE